VCTVLCVDCDHMVCVIGSVLTVSVLCSVLRLACCVCNLLCVDCDHIVSTVLWVECELLGVCTVLCIECQRVVCTMLCVECKRVVCVLC